MTTTHSPSAGVARASLYGTYGSKNELISAYLRGRSESCPRVGNILATVFRACSRSSPKWFATPGYRGCPFINASGEAAASGPVSEIRDQHRAWVRRLFRDLAAEAGAADPKLLSAQLVLLYDGCMVGAQLDQSTAPGEAARLVAGALLDSATQTAEKTTLDQ